MCISYEEFFLTDFKINLLFVGLKIHSRHSMTVKAWVPIS